MKTTTRFQISDQVETRNGRTATVVASATPTIWGDEAVMIRFHDSQNACATKIATKDINDYAN